MFILFTNLLKAKVNVIVKRSCSCTNLKVLKPPWRVLFFGSDDFSLISLKSLFSEYSSQKHITKLEVVTNPKQNVVRKFATNNNLTIHNWPITKLETFDLGLVVSFGHLIPQNVINMFPMGMLNVHASLLPRWRGAAPVIYALASGDTTTGVSIMRIRPKHFDRGEILLQNKIDIGKHVRLPELYNQLAHLGAVSLINVISRLPSILENCKPQSDDGVTLAPRVTSKIAIIDWNKHSALELYNLSRAIDGLYQITTYFNGNAVKLYNVKEFNRAGSKVKPGSLFFDKVHKLILVQCSDGMCISSDKIGINKKVISALDFNNGYVKNMPVEKRIFKNILE